MRNDTPQFSKEDSTSAEILMSLMKQHREGMEFVGKDRFKAIMEKQSKQVNVSEENVFDISKDASYSLSELMKDLEPKAIEIESNPEVKTLKVNVTASRRSRP